MYYLKSTNDVYLYLVGKTEFTCGRKNTDFLLNNDDSVSRLHARISVMDNKVFVVDAGSKYGTFIDEVQLEPKEITLLKIDSEIKFGLLQSCFKLCTLKLRVSTSNLKPDDRKELVQSLEALPAILSSDWSENSTHLVVSDFILTIKVLCALSLEHPIVRVAFFKEFAKAIQEHRSIPDHLNYIPELNESLLSKNIKVEYTSKRRILFKDKILVFMHEQKRKTMELLVKVTGGKAISWQKDQRPRSEIEASSPEYLFIESNLEDQSQSSSLADSFNATIRILNAIGRRSIPFQEIALAIVHCSTAEYCNSHINKTKLCVSATPTNDSEKILAYDTQHSLQSQPATQPEIIAPIVVQPSYEKETITPVLFNKPHVPKRSLDADQSYKCSLQPSSKRSRDNEPSTSSKTMSQFSFNRTCDSGAKHSLFSFNNDGVAEKSQVTIQADNPFARKRKASAAQLVEPLAKKTPLGNEVIARKSAITSMPDSFMCSTQIESAGTLPEFLQVSSILEVTGWISKGDKLAIKKEEVDDVMSVYTDDLAMEEELRKYNESFRNKIVLRTISANSIKRSIFDSGNVSAADSNFKKFKKVQPLFPQTRIEIMTRRIVVGNMVATDLSDEDDAVDDEFDDVDRIENRPGRLVKSRRKFRYAP